MERKDRGGLEFATDVVLYREYIPYPQVVCQGLAVALPLLDWKKKIFFYHSTLETKTAPLWIKISV